MTALTAAAEKLTELLAKARAGEPVTPEQLATARSEADAEAEINSIRATREQEQARERAERQRIADKAAAAAAARDELPAARERLQAAYQALHVILKDVTDAHRDYDETIRHHVKALTDTGHVGISYGINSWELADQPGFDPAIVPNSTNDTIDLDGVRYAAIKAGLGIVWAAMKAGHHTEIDGWKRSGNTSPLDPPLPEMRDQA
ncbi:hypothetical protein [Rhodococcus ruber]